MLSSMEYRATMVEKKLSASTVNVRLSAVRKLVGEAQRNGIIGAEEAANLAGVPNLPQKGTKAGELADAGPGQKTADRPRPFHAQGKARLRDPILISGLRFAPARAGQPGH